MGWDPRDTLSDAVSIGTGGLINLDVPDQPAAPDYTGAAEAEAAANLELAKYTTDVNRPDQYTPFGSTTWEQGFDQPGYDQALIDAQEQVGYYPDQANFLLPNGTLDEGRWQEAMDAYNARASGYVDKGTFEGTGDWTQTTTLSPEQQTLLEQQQEGQLLSGSLGIQGLEATQDMFSTPYQTGLDPLSSYDDQRANIISQLTSRTREDVGQARDQKISQLVAGGIPIGSEAYDREMKLFDRRLTDANQQAELGATDIISKMLADQRANRGQIMSEDLTERQTPLNEYTALTSGTPVQNPNMPSFSTQQQILGPDYLGATTAEGQWDLAGWNADVAQNNMILGGLFDFGAAAIGV